MEKYRQRQLASRLLYFLVTGRTKELLETEVLPIVEAHLKERGLELSREKTKITRIDKGFDFLGQNVRKYNGKLLIKPSKKNIMSFLDKIRETIKQHKAMSAGELIKLLNPKICGWANYHRHVVSKVSFNRVDSAIFECLWQWAKRRHPKKSRWWIQAKYFAAIGNDNWVFSGQAANKEGQLRNCHLFNAASVPIKRHVKVRGEANPYAAEWEEYFERRTDVQMETNLRGYKRLLSLWREQNGICPVCEEKITLICRSSQLCRMVFQIQQD